MRRRSFLRCNLFVATGLSAPMINRGRLRLFAQSASEYSRRTVDLIGRSNVIDMLCPVTMDFEKRRRWRSQKGSISSKDLQLLKASGITIVNPAEGWPSEGTIRFLSEWNSLIAQYDSLFLRVDTMSDFERVKGSGRLGVVLGTQNSEHFQSANDVTRYYELGQRVSQLTYNYRNIIGDGCMERHGGGLSQLGAGIVQKMNEVGMAIDVSHCGDMTTLDALEISKKPVLITHSNCRTLVPGHVRCKSDEAIKRMAASGGVMGVTLLRMMVRAEDPTTIEHVLDHYDHVTKLVGTEHLGIGTDWAIIPRDQPASPEELKRNLARYDPAYRMRDTVAVDGINYPQKVYDLVEGLVRRKYTDRSIEGIVGENFRRALSAIWVA